MRAEADPVWGRARVSWRGVYQESPMSGNVFCFLRGERRERTCDTLNQPTRSRAKSIVLKAMHDLVHEHAHDLVPGRRPPPALSGLRDVVE